MLAAHHPVFGTLGAAPAQIGLVDFLLVGGGALRLLAEEPLDLCLGWRVLTVAVEPVLRRLEAGPARDGGREVHLPPFRVVLGRQEPLEPIEEGGREALQLPVPLRALRMIVEGILLDLMFDVPSDPTIQEILINKECITEKKPPEIIRSS